MFKTIKLFLLHMLCFTLGYADGQVDQSALQDLSVRSRCHHRRHHSSSEHPCPERVGPPGPRGGSVRAYANLFLESLEIFNLFPISTSGTGILFSGMNALSNLGYDSSTGEVIIIHEGDYLIEVAASLANFTGSMIETPISYTLGIVKGNLQQDPSSFTVESSYAIHLRRPGNEAATLEGQLILTLHPGDRIAFANVDTDPSHSAHLYPPSSPLTPPGIGTVATLNIRLLDGKGS
jgi:hypothetical protein